MIQTTVKFDGPRGGLGVNSASLFQKAQMERLGKFAISTIRKRVARGIGSDDSAMPPLSAKHSAVKVHGKFVRQRVPYSQFKASHGLQPIRDLAGTGKDGGHMLDNLSVRSVSETNVRMGFTQNKARQKALSNEKKTPWLGFSDGDERAIIAYAEQMFRSQVEVIRRQMFTGSARNGRYVDSPLSLPALSLTA